MTKFLAFDIETAKITPDGEDIQQHRPLGICCWATAWEQNGKIITRTGCGKDYYGKPTPQLSMAECQVVVAEMRRCVETAGCTIITHNGTGFDFDILAEESGLYTNCSNLAMNAIDTCLYVHAVKGFPIGLEAIAKGMGLPGKTEGMNGALAPVMWAEGKYEEVLAYVAQGAKSTLEVALEIEKRGGLIWIAKSGRHNTLRIPRLLTVKECLGLPEPNTSWMTEPIPRSKFVGWMETKREGEHATR